MKKIFVMLLIALFLVSCTGNDVKEEIPTESETAEQKQNVTETLLDTDDINEETAESILNEEIKIDIFGKIKNATLYELGYVGIPARYALVDFDGDGERELVFEFSPSGDRAIIDKNDGVYTAYYLSIRSANDIKKDGTMSWSSSAFESGAQKIRFENGQLIKEDIIVYNTTENLFTVKGENVSEEEGSRALALQYQKESVEWIEIE